MKTRRQFLKVSAIGAIGASLPLTKVEAAPVESNKSGNPFTLGFAGYTFVRLSIDKSIEIMKKTGVKNLSIKDFHMPYKSTAEEINEITGKFKAEGLNIYGVGVVYMTTKEFVDQAFEYARMAGAKVMICAPNYELLPYVNEKVKSADFKLAIHNHGPDNTLYPNATDIWDHIKDLDPKIGICIDIGHTTRDGQDPVKDILRYKTRIYDVHIKDVDKASKEGKTVEMGRGIIDIPGVVNALRKINFTGSCSLEYEKDMADPLGGIAESIGYWKGVSACK
ncbi:MAG TPA: sugar phosphate isomerase/epimerase [Bacteroidales bacterium]|nr:sugar phosphate isomerase/epimerase [Bacteroidales bacterium]